MLSTRRRLLLTLLLLALPIVGYAAQPVPIGPGTSHLNLYQPEGPWAIHVLTADLTDENLKLESLLGGGEMMGKSGVTRMLSAGAYDWHKPIGGVNADYFASTGGNHVTIPLGFHLQNAELVTLPDPTRSAFYVTADGKAGIERFYGTARVTGPEGLTYPIHVMNRAPNAAQVALFTPRFGIETRAAGSSLQILLDGASGKFLPNGEVTAKVVGTGTGPRAEIPATGAVLAANGVAAWALSRLKVGDEVTLHLDLEPGTGELSQVIGGGPRLVRDGSVSVEHRQEGFADSFATRRHPRTGLAVKGMEIMLVTVDGRQPGYSEGMTLTEFAQLLVSLGATEAINLDGGGSTTMVVRDKIVNSPSDGPERRVANALALFSLAPPLAPGAPPRPATRVFLDPQEVSLLAGESVTLTPSGLDEYCEPTPVDPTGLQWELTEGLGTIAADGAFTADRVAARTTGTITVKNGTASTSAAVTVLPGPARLALTPSQVSLAPGAKQQFTVRAYDQTGAPVQLTPGHVTWTCTPATGTVSTRGLFRAPGTEGEFTVTAAVREVSAQATVLVGATSRVVQNFEMETPVSFLGYPGGVTGSATITDDPLRKGNSCLKLAYDFSTVTDTRAAYAVLNLPLPETRAIALRVLGDGQGEWLRAKVRDAADHTYLVDLAQHVNWSKQWRPLSAWIPQEALFPITLESVYVSEIHPEDKPAGAVYVDDIAVTMLAGEQEESGEGQ